MRIEFPHSAREPLNWTQDVLRVGSAPDNDLVIGARQGAAHHLRIVQDRRGWVLQVLPEGGRVYLNARPVRERAMLRPGDVLSVGDCRLQLCADQAPQTREPPPVLAGTAQRTAALRAVAGALSGRVLPLDRRLELGPRGSHALELPQGESATLVLEWQQGRLRVRASGPARYPLRVNGHRVEQATLHPGDQLALALHRFVVDLPGVVPEPGPAADPPPEVTATDPATPRSDVWWLIATAAVLALGIALVLFFRI